MMNPAVHHSSLFLIILILFNFQLLASPSNEADEDIESSRMLSNPRLLFGQNISSSTNEHRRPSFPHPALHKPELRTKNHKSEGGKEERRKRLRMIAAILLPISGGLVLFGAMLATALVRRRWRRRNASRPNASNKVCLDPEPDLFYFDSLAPFLESDSNRKLFSRSKSAASLNHENHLEPSPSEGSESFHSICCSHCSIESSEAQFEPCLNLSSPPISSRLNALATNCIHSAPLVEASKKQRKEDTGTANRLYTAGIYTPAWTQSAVEMKSEESTVKMISDNVESSSSEKQFQKRESNKEIRKSPPLPPPPPPPSQKHSRFGKPSSPPFQLQQSSAIDKNGSPLPKLKPLHWDKVRTPKDRSMVWDQIRSSSFVLDEKTIESLFGYSIHCSAMNNESKNRKLFASTQQVFEPKRLQNLTILLKALNASVEQVCSALILGNGLSAQQLEALAKLTPTNEEEERMHKYEGSSINALESTEKFLKEMLHIPSAFSRIEVMLYRETFDDEVTHLKKSFEILEEACKELKSSGLFLKLLEAVLKTGNRMNSGTIRGGARAFKLDALLKLTDVKGTDGKTTLLHFVVQEMIKSESLNAQEKSIEKALAKNKGKSIKEWEEARNARELELVSALSNELCNVKKTATLDLDVLASSVSNLCKGMSKLKELVENLSKNKGDSSFVSSFSSFQKHGDKKIEELKCFEDRVFCEVKEITEYYHGDVSKDEVNPLRIFIIISDFLGTFDRVCKELKCSKSSLSLNLVVL